MADKAGIPSTSTTINALAAGRRRLAGGPAQLAGRMRIAGNERLHLLHPRQVDAEQFAAGMQSLSREQYVVMPTHELPSRVEASASRVSSRANTRPMPARSRISPSESVRL